MLVFIDESGHPHPNDPTTRPVLAAVYFGIKRTFADGYFRRLWML